MTDRPTPTPTAGVVIGADGRAKAYRPLPDATRAEALAAGLAAYASGDFFEAHELLEPAWMGTDDPAERALLQGLIKLAAAYVHDVRGNPAGIRKNLEGARARLVEGSGDPRATRAVGVDIDRLVADIDARLVDLDDHPTDPTLPPPMLQGSHR